MLIFLKDVIYGIGIIAGCALLLVTIAGNLWLFYIVIETVVNEFRREYARNKHYEREWE